MHKEAGHPGGCELIGSPLQRGQLAVTLQQRAVVRSSLLLRLRQLALMGGHIAGDLSKPASVTPFKLAPSLPQLTDSSAVRSR